MTTTIILVSLVHMYNNNYNQIILLRKIILILSENKYVDLDQVSEQPEHKDR